MPYHDHKTHWDENEGLREAYSQEEDMGSGMVAVIAVAAALVGALIVLVAVAI